MCERERVLHKKFYTIRMQQRVRRAKSAMQYVTQPKSTWVEGTRYYDYPQPNPTLQKIKLVADVALNKAHEMGIIKTYDQAVQEYEDDDKLDEWRSHPKPVEGPSN